MADINSYPVFEPNQVLNHTHLNSMRNYLEEQNRMTRSRLIGTGIACGLGISVNSQHHITLSQGCGITSEGYLLCLAGDTAGGETVFTHYKPYPTPTTYPPFAALSSAILELLTQDEDGADPLSGAGFLNDKVVLAYLESEDQKTDSCAAQDCNDQGTWRVFERRFLLISREDAVKLLKNANPDLSGAGTSDDAVAAVLNQRFRLDEAAIRRISCVATAQGKNIQDLKSFGDFAVLYVEAIAGGLDNVKDAIEGAYGTFKPVLQESIPNEELQGAVKRLNDLIKFFGDVMKAGSPDLPQMVQYYYDFVKDLIDASNEFNETAFDLMADCGMDDTRFPRHLLLGTVTGSAGCEPSVFRHHFRQPPIYNGNAMRLKEAVRLFKKMLIMIDAARRLDSMGAGDPIKITPSRGPAESLSSRAIPFYYNVPKTPGSLYEYWSYAKYRRCRAKSNLSYHAETYNDKDCIKNPLCYNYDAYPFLRIEGHIGKAAQEAFDNIDSLRQAFNIPFELVMLADGDSPLHASGTSQGYEDLQTIYAIWRHKFLLYLNNLLRLTYYLEQNLPGRGISREDLFKAGDEAFSYFSLWVLNRAGQKVAAQPGYATAAKSKPAEMGQPAELYGIGRDASYAYRAMQDRAAWESLFTGERATAASGAADAGYLSSDEKFVRDELKELNTCLTDLSRSLVPDLKDFKFAEFYEHYKCCTEVNIDIMNYLAESLKQAEADDGDLFVFKIFCWIYHLLSAFAIRPYIDIRILLDNLEQRKAVSSQAQKLSEFMKEKTGMEHQAGVYKGGTFILVYKSDGSHGEIVADFSLPYVGCRQADQRRPVTKPLSPLVLKVCAVVEPSLKDGQKEFTYPEVALQLLNNVYDPALFVPKVLSNPKYGTTIFEDPDPVYEPEPKKSKKILHYQVDTGRIMEVLKKDKTKLIIVDAFDYGLQDKAGVTIEKSSVMVFILLPALSGQAQTAVVYGRVTTGNGKIGLGGVTVSDEKGHSTTTKTVGKVAGGYSMEISAGKNNISAAHENYVTQTKSVDVPPGDNYPLDFDLKINEAFEVDWGKFRVLTDAMEVAYGSAKAEEVMVAYDSRMEKYRKKIEDVKDDPEVDPGTPIYEVADTMELFLEDEKINIVKMNNEYADKRDKLFKGIQKASGKEKALQVEAYKALTMAYIDRLALKQPKDFSDTTQKTIAATAAQMNSDPDLNMEEEISEWSTQVDDVLPDKFIGNVRDKMFRS
jgi:hypothetical protein